MKILDGALAPLICFAAACQAGPSAGATDQGSTSDEDETSTTDTPTDMSPDACGDEVVSGVEECEPGGPIPCNDDCTLPADGPGSVEWVFVDDTRGWARAVAIDDSGRATVVGEYLRPTIDPPPHITIDAWLRRFEPDGTPGWQVEEDSIARGGSSAYDLRLDASGHTIVVGWVGLEDASAWIAAYGDDGTQLWSRSEMIGSGNGAHASAVEILGDRIYVAINADDNWQVPPEPRLMVFTTEGTPLMTRTWTPDYLAFSLELAADPLGSRIVQVGRWTPGNWIEALDIDGQTLWTANEVVDPMPMFGGTATVYDVAVDPDDGGIYVAGQEKDFSPGPFSVWGIAYVRRLGANGEADWTTLFWPDGAPTVAIADSTVYTANFDEGELTLRAFDAHSGELLWTRRVSIANGERYVPLDLRASLDSLWVVGFRSSDESPLIHHPWIGRLRRE